MNEEIGRVIDNTIMFKYTRHTEIRCPHCRSGWVILTVGVEKGKVNQVAFCRQDNLDHPIYCPYCGKDMREETTND